MPDRPTSAPDGAEDRGGAARAGRTAPAARHDRRHGDHRRQELIAATIQVIATHGLADVTLAKVAGLAGLTAGMVNFHFATKQALLTAALRELAEEYQRGIEEAAAASSGDPADVLGALIEVNFSSRLSSPEKVAATYAYWSETQAREEYQALCGSGEKLAFDIMLMQCKALIRRDNLAFDAESVARGLDGLIDSLWQRILLERASFARSEAISLCHRYLRNFFPDAFPAAALTAPSDAPLRVRSGDDGQPREGTGETRTLAAWSYCSSTLAEAERSEIHLTAWHPVCHVSDITEPGTHMSLDLLGERIFVIRGEDGVVRGFHNVCPHRAHPLVRGGGQCAGLIRCPYHAWGFDLRGQLKSVAGEKAFPPFDSGAFSLKPVECEIAFGFVFVRLAAGRSGKAAGLAERLAPHAGELARYRFEEMVAIEELFDDEMEADWKNVWDNYLEDYHFPTGHPGLFALMSPAYDRKADDAARVVRLSHAMRKQPKGSWSVRAYASLLPRVEHLPEEMRRRWTYFFIYPGAAFNIYPDGVNFMHVLPLGAGRSRIRFRTYGHASDDRRLAAARWLNRRINFAVHGEDLALIAEVQKGLAGGAYSAGLLNPAKESAVAAFQRWVRADLPVTGRLERPGGM